ncbi:MAG: hypothetical protein ABI728_05745 [Betaproteobacteria bacterium]
MIALALVVAWQVARHWRLRLAATTPVADPDAALKIRIGGKNRELAPVTVLVVLLLSRWVLTYLQPVHLLNIAVPLALAMVMIRAVVYLLRHTFAPGGHLRSWEMAITWLVWVGVALHIVGLLPAIGRFLEDTGFRVGQERLSLAMVLTALLTVVLTLLAALWIGRLVEARIMTLKHVEINLRYALTKIVRSVLVVIAVRMARREAIVPNETVVTSMLINHSYSNGRVLIRIPVQISYSSNLESAMKLMLEAANSNSRVLKDPSPTAVLTSFGDNGINLELPARLGDPEPGKLNLNSDLNLAMYRNFSANGIETPFP